MYQLLYIITTCVIIVTSATLLGGASSFSFSWLFVKFILKGQLLEGDVLGVSLWALMIGLLFALLSLIPSYKLSLKLADYLRERGMVEIKEPKKMFFLALFIPFLLLAFLIIWGAVVMK